MTKLLIAGVLWVMGCAAGWAAAPDAKKSLTPVEASAVRAVVQAQLDAFALDDAAKAFSFASPDIRNQFGDASTFMSMVRQGYPMVIRPASISFFQPAAQGGAVWQVLRLRDQQGRVWRAVYELRRQPDKTWRVNGCTVQPDSEGSTT